VNLNYNFNAGEKKSKPTTPTHSLHKTNFAPCSRERNVKSMPWVWIKKTHGRADTCTMPQL